ncbi:Rof/RNase P-like protein [Lactarius tabidus]
MSSSLYQGAILPDDATTGDKNTTTASTHVRLTSAHPYTPEFVQRQLQLPPKPKSKAQARALYDERVRRRQLVLAPKPPNREKKDRRARHGDSDDKCMGRREAAEKGLWRLRASEAKWELFVPLHRLWCGYMTELLGLGTGTGTGRKTPTLTPAAAAGMHAKLVKADFHGSIVTVRRSKNAALVGLSGIVVQETENTFKIVTRVDKLKVLPKQGSVFVFAVPAGTTGDGMTVHDGPHVEFELYGNQFCFRAADRAGRKFKHKESIEL